MEMGNILNVKNGRLYINGSEFKLYSGAVHYFRIHPSQWRDRLTKLKECGLNTVETYIAWNVQEPELGNFCFDGMADFERFISIAEDLELYVIVRPGPFICAEWEMGGLPSWLLNIEGIELRHYNEPFLKCVRKYFEMVFEKIRPHLYANGGGVIALQIENEFGGLGQPDEEYLKWIKRTYEELGGDALYFTSDGTWSTCLEDGSLDDILMTANFGSRTEQAFDRLESLRPGEPKICMEFWNGWFDQWRTEHHTREARSVIDELKTILKLDGNFNMYMFSGGTNFGFMNGSNCNPDFEPCITSYDYGAPVAEDGSLTEQYRLLKKLLTGSDEIKDDHKSAAYGAVSEFSVYGLFDNAERLGAVHKNSKVRCMEELGQRFGYILYEADVTGMSGVIDIGEPRDRVMFYADDVFIGEYERGIEYGFVEISGAKRLKIFIENMGRVNYGPRLYDKKGLLQNVRIGEDEVKVYDITNFPMEKLDTECIGCSYAQPALYKAEFEVGKTEDTYLLPSGFTKGVAFVNGFNLGRYWNKGPQQTLYVPAGVLRPGENELIVFDLYPSKAPKAEFIDRHILDELK